MKYHIFNTEDLSINSNRLDDVASVFNSDVNQKINTLILTIDNLLYISNSEGRHITNRNQVIKQVKVAFNDLRKLITDHCIDHPLVEKCCHISLDSAENYILSILHDVESHQRIKIEKQNKYNEEKLADLRTHGFAEYSIGESLDFDNESYSLLTLARKQYLESSDWRDAVCVVDFNNHPLYKMVEKFIRKNGVDEMLSNYMKSQIELAWATPIYSHHRQRWFRIENFDELSPTNYYHLDADHNIVKVLVYLTDVNEGDGPFKYVKESNLWKKSPTTFALHLAMDKKVNAFLYGSRASFKINIFTQNPELLSQFPDSFIGSTHFGDFLKVDSAIAQALLKCTETFTRKKGTLIIFDGNRGIHSGGNPEDGERLVLQLAFRRRPGFVAVIRKKFTSLIRRVRHKVFNVIPLNPN